MASPCDVIQNASNRADCETELARCNSLSIVSKMKCLVTLASNIAEVAREEGYIVPNSTGPNSGAGSIPQPADVCAAAAQIGIALPGCAGGGAGGGAGTGTGGGSGAINVKKPESFLTSTTGMVVIAGGLTALTVGALIMKSRSRKKAAGVAGVRGKRRGKRSGYLSGIGCGGNIGCSGSRNLGCGCR